MRSLGIVEATSYAKQCSESGDHAAACDKYGTALSLADDKLGPGARDLSDTFSEASISLLQLFGLPDAAARFQKALLQLRLLRLSQVQGG